MALLLGIDIGTSSAKAVLFDADTVQTVAVSNGHEYPIHKPQPDYAEQNPDDWWQAVVAAVRDLIGQVGKVNVAAIGFSGQMHGGVLLDAHKRPLHPAIIWPDQRTPQEVQALLEPFTADEFVAITGTMPSVGFMGVSLLWLQKHRPDVFGQAHYTVFPKDYVRLKMTGQVHGEPSDAVSSALFDVRTRQWSEKIIGAVGLPKRIFPPIVDSAAVVGELQADAAEQLGLSPGIPVVAGCADQAAQLLGNGLIAPGKAAVVIGSGGQVIMPIDNVRRTDKRLHVFNHALPDMWYIMGAILAAGLSLRWLRDVTGLKGVSAAYETLSHEAATTPPGADGLVFLPYLSGERTPHMDPQAKGVFFGLNYHHTRGHLARAVMEGVTFALYQALTISLELGGQVEAVLASGGGAESAVWRQVLADIFGLPLHQTILTEQGSIGAALLAGVGVGMYDSFETACAPLMRYGRLTEPDRQQHQFYRQRYEQFLRLYPLLQTEMRQNQTIS